MAGENEPDKKQDGGIQQSQNQPQSMQFQIPFQLVPQQPIMQVPIIVQPTQQSDQQPQQLSGVQNLADSVNESTREGNATESKIPEQIILITSATIAIVGGFALSSHAKLPKPIAAVLVASIVSLGVALLTGVLHYASERRFWYRHREMGIFALKIIGSVQNPAEKHNAAVQASNLIDGGSNRLAFWIQIYSFIIGVTLLVALVVVEIFIST